VQQQESTTSPVRVQIIFPSCITQQHESTVTPVFSQTSADARVARADAATSRESDTVTKSLFMTASLFLEIVVVLVATRPRDHFRMGRTNPLRGGSRILSVGDAKSRTERLRATAKPETAISGETTFFARSSLESLYRDTGHPSQSVEQHDHARIAVLQSETQPIPRMARSAAIFAPRFILFASTRTHDPIIPGSPGQVGARPDDQAAP